MPEEANVRVGTSFDFLVRSVLAIEKARVATQVRKTHLALAKKSDPETDELLVKIEELEEYVDGRLAKLIESHPAFPWFSQVKGIGRENIAKVLGPIDIQKAATISALWKFCGFSVENGHAPKRVKGGGKLSYNSQLRSLCWRMGSSLLKARGSFYEYYLNEKEKYLARYADQGMKIIPAAKLPKDKNGKRNESEGVISEGHVHNQALRKMIKLFLACLWLTWREAEGLPTRSPYPIEKLGHTGLIDPWEMADRGKGVKSQVA
jgi:hypothetical protein